ncbi:MAG: hypothetical protein IKB34_05905 [Clostridia bacterium]|nr:hypothetical protein [Clostridia bacterium]
MENISRNLLSLRLRGISLSERRLAHIDDAAYVLARRFSDDINGEYDAFRAEYKRLVSQIMPASQELPCDVPEENRERVFIGAAEEAVNVGIFLCSSICEQRRRMGALPELSSFFPLTGETEDNARIAYLRNPFSDTAYRVFSEAILNASVSYPRDFNSVCEEVYYGRCKYCILPIETSDEGGLSGFRRLITKYELCPVLSCSVSSGGGSQTTRFALFSKNIERLELSDRKGVTKEREIFSFRLNAPTEDSLVKTVKSMHIYGMRLLKVDSIPVSWDEGHYSFEFSAECDSGDIHAMLLYLALEIPEYTPIGLYSQIKVV